MSHKRPDTSKTQSKNNRSLKKRKNPVDDMIAPPLPAVELCEAEKFKRRLLSNLEIKKTPKLLSKFFNLENLKNIYQTILNTIVRNPKLIQKLTPGEAIRFSKSGYHLSKNAQIVCSKKGKLRLFVETNTHDKEGNYIEDAILGAGTSKTVLRCYRIDSTLPMEWACGKVKDKDNDEVVAALNEATTMNELDHPHIAKAEPGVVYKKGSKVALFSKLAIGTLMDVIKGKIPATDLEKQTLMFQIFDAMAYVHKQNIVHQDLKPHNILIYRAKDNSLIAKVADFGLCSMPNAPEEVPSGTLGYASPEVLAYHSDSEANLHERFFKSPKRSLGRDVVTELHKKPSYKNLQPHPKNDCWSLGILYYKLLHGVKPSLKVLTTKKKSGNKVIDGLLNIDRDKRFDVDTAVSLMLEGMKPSVQNSDSMEPPAKKLRAKKKIR